MEKEITYPEEHTLQGVTESFRGSLDGLARSNSNRYTINHGSFRLKDGRYAYRDYVWMEEPKRAFYHILSIEDEEILKLLDYWDKLEEKQNRRGGAVSDHESYAYQNHLQRDNEDEENAPASPVDKYLYTEWYRDECAINNEDASMSRRFPLKAEYAIIHALLQELTPAERQVYEYLFAGKLSDEEIKGELHLEHSTWSMEKRRFLDKVRAVFSAAGYDVPSPEELAGEREGYRARLNAIRAQQNEDAKDRNMGRSICREAALSEQTSRPRAFVEKDDRVQADIEEMLLDDKEELKRQKKI